MTGTLTDLMRAICEFPAEDTPRLEYADAMDELHERATERAEFIRVQIELTKTPKMLPPGQLVWSGASENPVIVGLTIHDTENPKWAGLYKREDELWGYGEPGSWSVDDPLAFPYSIRCIETETISKSTATHDPIVIYRRGFPSSITCTAQDWLTHADAIYWHPEMVVKCDNCDGRGETRFCDAAGDMDDEPCLKCGGSLRGGYKRGDGRMSAPFVAVTQPITEVTLTDFLAPGGNCWNEFKFYNKGNRVWNTPRWQNIAFHCPNSVGPYPPSRR